MHSAHVLYDADGIGIEANIVEEPFHIGDHVVELTCESGNTILLDFHWLEVLH